MIANPIPSVSVSYGRNGTSTTANALGMRRQESKQARAVLWPSGAR
jgi:hypothetical protein